MKTTEAVTSGVSSSRLTGWRPAWEGWSAAAGFAAAGTTAAMVPGWWGAGLASVLGLMGVVRTAEALRTASRRIPLAGFAPAFIHAGDLIRILREKGMDEKKAVDPARKTARERLVARYEAGRIALLDSMRFNAGREGRLVKNLWIGRGFEWTPAHAQALYELAATPVKPVIVPKRIRKALSLPDPLGAGDIGSPIIHGIGATEEDDIVRPLSSLGGGTLIVGTTQAGKGVMLTSLVTQAILRGEPVIVIDPKSSKRLRNAVWKAAEIAGRPAPLEFHPAFPETGVRLDPLGAWTRPTELATRIAAVMPPDSGAFGNFAWMAVNVAVEGLFYVTERPSLLGLRRLLEGGIDPLLKKALARSFRDAGIDDWEEQVERMDKRNICPPAANAGIELTAAVALWEETVGKKDEGDANAVVGGLIAVFRHNREHYAKITASLQPVLSMLTGGTLAKSFSPDPFDPDDERPIVTVERVVEGGDILYLSLDALPDSTVAGARIHHPRRPHGLCREAIQPRRIGYRREVRLALRGRDRQRHQRSHDRAPQQGARSRHSRHRSYADGERSCSKTRERQPRPHGARQLQQPDCAEKQGPPHAGIHLRNVREDHRLVDLRLALLIGRRFSRSGLPRLRHAQHPGAA